MDIILPRNQPLNIGDAIIFATSYLNGHNLGFGHGTSSPVDDAAWLVLEAAQMSPVEQPDYTLPMSADAVTRCEEYLHRRVIERIPVAYIVGRTWFAGIEFAVDQRALIPRSPISELIMNGFHALVDTSIPFTALDLCTGGGCIAIAIARLLPEASVVATDLSPGALALAKQNVDFYKLEHKVKLLQGDLFGPVDQSFDLIVSNPPYVDALEIEHMDAEFLHEPEMGLGSGSDGLDLTRRILVEASDYLNPGGVLIVEVGNSADALEKAFPVLPFLWFGFSNGGGGVFALTREELCGDFKLLD